MDGRIELETHAVSQASQVVEDAHDVGHLKTALIVQAGFAQGRPIFLHHTRGLCRQLLGHGQQRALTIAQIRQFLPSMFPDRLREIGVPAFRTQKLCVTTGSVKAVLRGGRSGGHHFPLLSGEDRIGREHDLGVELYEGGRKA